MDNSLSRIDKQQSDLERYLDCSEVRLKVDSCKIDKYTKDINILVLNQSQMDLPDFILSILGKTYDGEEFNQNILFSKKLKKGENSFLTTLDAVTVFDDSNIDDLDLRKIDQISLGNQRCNTLFISDLNCEIVDSLEDHLVAYYSLDQEDLIYNELEGSEWENASAWGRGSGTTYYERNGDVIIVNRAEGNWPGAGILYPANKKTKYNIKAEFNVLNGKGFVGYHLYKDGSVVNYNVSTDTQEMFSAYHPSTYFNYNANDIGSYKIDTTIDLSSAPDFDSIHFAILDYNNPNFTNLPAVVFNVNSVSVSEVLVEDLSGYGNHGEIRGPTFTEDQKGKANSAMLFNGISDYIYINNSMYDQRSLSVWVKPDNWNDRVIAAGFLSSGSHTNLVAYYNSVFSIGTGSESLKVRTTNTYNDNLWHNVTVVRKDDMIDIYVDGVKQAVDLTGSYRASQRRLIGARYLNAYEQFFSGPISDLKVYNKELTEKEIKVIYNETRTN
jgi:hypothetical protein